MLRSSLQRDLERRMSVAQRHRLLHGYPMAPLMREPPAGYDPLTDIDLDPNRPLIIGVLPHTFCNPRVKGCGFCTFPHEKFARDVMTRVLLNVGDEIDATIARAPSLCGRRIASVYFGGGTANLAPAAGIRRLLTRLEAHFHFDLSVGELTLEGVPKYFLLNHEAHLDVLSSARVRHRRISMGIQTFDEGFQEQMGREAFGACSDIESLLAAAQSRGFTASADLLVNLPGTGARQGCQDANQAMDLGFDQVCIYNLVLSSDIESEWSKKRSVLAAMPDSERACATYLAVRERLLEGGYVQTTLTNFERSDTKRTFLYEAASFEPQTYDAIGFGPGAISTFTNADATRALKWSNVATSDDYVARMSVSSGSRAAARTFDYAGIDLRLLHITRNLATMRIDRAAYAAWFGSDVVQDFEEVVDVLTLAGLTTVSARSVDLTPRGMFFADSVAGLLASRRVSALRGDGDAESAHRHHMG